MNKNPQCKQNVYFTEQALQEIKEEAIRLDRTLSWVVQKAWKIAKDEIKLIPSSTSEKP